VNAQGENVVEPGAFEILVGPASCDQNLSTVKLTILWSVVQIWALLPNIKKYLRMATLAIRKYFKSELGEMLATGVFLAILKPSHLFIEQ
jgi:hypothetical protein